MQIVLKSFLLPSSTTSTWMSRPVSINVGLLAITAGAAFLAGNAFSNTAARWRSSRRMNMVPFNMQIRRHLGMQNYNADDAMRCLQRFVCQNWNRGADGFEMARKQPSGSLRSSRAHWSQYLKVPFTWLTTWHRIQVSAVTLHGQPSNRELQRCHWEGCQSWSCTICSPNLGGFCAKSTRH